MRTDEHHTLQIKVPGLAAVAVALRMPANPFACCALAHDPAKGRETSLEASLAQRLSDEGIGTLTYALAAGARRKLPPGAAVVRAAVALAGKVAPGLPLFAGGIAFGARTTSRVCADRPLPVRGLILFGFPLHMAGKPSTARAGHLERIAVPMLLLQGAGDAQADRVFLLRAIQPLGARATLHLVEEADHAFRVSSSSDLIDARVEDDLARTAADWVRDVLT